MAGRREKTPEQYFLLEFPILMTLLIIRLIGAIKLYGQRLKCDVRDFITR